MSELLEKIYGYLSEYGKTLEELKEASSSSDTFAMQIAEYAHKDQYRVNGYHYIIHPYHLVDMYLELIGIYRYSNYHFEEELLEEVGLPYKGMIEVCYLHDVLEDTEITLEELVSLYKEQGLEDYFNMYVKTPLLLITHEKSMPYEEYIKLCMEHPVSALVKMLDMQDNNNMFSLDTFDNVSLNRSTNYMKYMFIINNKYHFIEKFNEYHLKQVK